MNLAIIGSALVSPIGLTPLQHACFVRAGLGLCPPSAFVGTDGEPAPVFHCPWLGAKLSIAERLAALGERALQSASEVLERMPHVAPGNMALLMNFGATRPGLVEADRQAAASMLATATPAPLRRVFTGAASFFAALLEADRLLEAGEVRVVVLVAVESFVSLDAVRAELEIDPPSWTREPPPLSEAAAALVVTKGAGARELGLSLGTVHYAGTTKGAGSDDDDLVVDGTALAALLDGVPAGLGPIARVYGQAEIDSLRMAEWTCASARHAALWHETMTIECVERSIGRVGAASAAAQIAHGLAAERHHAAREHAAGAAPFVAWAVSRDGTRGLCAMTAMATNAPGPEHAILGRPRLVAFVGPCAHAPPHDAPSREFADTALGDEEPSAVRPNPVEVHLDDQRTAPISSEAFMEGIVASAADTMAMLAEHRVTRPFALRATREARILKLADAILVSGERALVDVVDWSERAYAEGHVWALWPAVFLLGLVNGPDGLLGLVRMFERLPVDASDAVHVATNALASSPHLGVVAFAADLLDSDHPIASAIGIDVLSRRGTLDVARASSLLDNEAPARVAAAVRALTRIAAPLPPPEADERVGSLLSHSDVGVAWEAARAVTLWGDDAALCALRERRPLVSALGTRAAELFVMGGSADDLVHLEDIIASTPMTPDLLHAIGRFGNPLTWSFLLHHLADAELADAAREALLMLFGPIVEPEARLQPSVWRAALAERDLDPSLRYRHGAPWTPVAIARDLRMSTLTDAGSQGDMERDLDELWARTGLWSRVDLDLWGSDAGTRLHEATENTQSARWRAGSWHDARRRRR
ncbi:Hypothetical protein A7982_03856 [Minicystis rosea]|nr:Hypothetical protein A7982_03856 [Minicystis rosea]